MCLTFSFYKSVMWKTIKYLCYITGTLWLCFIFGNVKKKLKGFSEMSICELNGKCVVDLAEAMNKSSSEVVSAALQSFVALCLPPATVTWRIMCLPSWPGGQFFSFSPHKSESCVHF